MMNKVALITGGAKGIGGAIAERFVEAGAAVSVFDLDGAAAQQHADQLSLKGRVIAIQGDVTHEEDASRAVKETVAHFGSLNVLVNNVSIDVPGSVVGMTTSAWDEQIAVNVKGAFLLSKYAIPQMANGGGAIINVSSVCPFMSWTGGIGYETSKAALIGLTRNLAQQYGKDKIRANAVCPGYVNTPLVEEWLKTQPDREQAVRQVVAAHPLRRIGSLREVAEAVLFLASDAASFITGAALEVDGGMSIVLRSVEYGLGVSPGAR